MVASVMFLECTLRISPTSTERKQEKTDHKWGNAIASLEYCRCGATDQDNVSKTTHKDANHDDLVPAKLNISNICSVNGDGVG